jgi:hypothetical protein
MESWQEIVSIPGSCGTAPGCPPGILEQEQERLPHSCLAGEGPTAVRWSIRSCTDQLILTDSCGRLRPVPTTSIRETE